MNPVRDPYGGRNYLDTYSEDPNPPGAGPLKPSGASRHKASTWCRSTTPQRTGNLAESRRFDRRPAACASPDAGPALPVAVRDAQPASIMCAYNINDGVSACSNAELLNQDAAPAAGGLRGAATTRNRRLYDLAPSIKAGVDWELPYQMPGFTDRGAAGSARARQRGITPGLRNWQHHGRRPRPMSGAAITV